MRAFRWATVVFATVTFAFFLLLYTQALGPAATVAVDDYLCTIAPITAGVLCLRRSRRETGRVRLGWTMLGFAAAAWGLGGLADALVGRIARVLNQPVRLTERTVHVRASIGIAHSDDGPDVDRLLRLADGDMYRAKRNGRDRLPAHGRLELPRPR